MRVSLSLLYSIGAVILFLCAGVFVMAFRFALKEAVAVEDSGRLPRASVHRSRANQDARWRPAPRTQRVVGRLYLAQAGLVAFGITSVFFMLLCMTGIFLAMLTGI